jgi:hypothetical protein
MGTPTAEKVLAMRKKEKSACGTVAFSMAQKVLKARKAGITFTSPPFSGIIGNASIRTEADKKQTVTYNPSTFADQVAKIGDAISRGYVYVVGATSGLAHDLKKWPDPEHYLLLFAYDGGTNFAFWDPDAQRSDIASRPVDGQGFGIAKLLDTHFSTAWTSADFDEIDPRTGDHKWEPTRHRYQLYQAQPLPVPKRK